MLISIFNDYNLIGKYIVILAVNISKGTKIVYFIL